MEVKKNYLPFHLIVILIIPFIFSVLLARQWMDERNSLFLSGYKEKLESFDKISNIKDQHDLRILIDYEMKPIDFVSLPVKNTQGYVIRYLVKWPNVILNYQNVDYILKKSNLKSYDHKKPIIYNSDYTLWKN